MEQPDMSTANIDFAAWRKPRPLAIAPPADVQVSGPHLPQRLMPRQDRVPLIASGRPTHIEVKIETLYKASSALAFVGDSFLRGHAATGNEIMIAAGYGRYIPPRGARIYSGKERIPDPVPLWYGRYDRNAQISARGW